MAMITRYGGVSSAGYSVGGMTRREALELAREAKRRKGKSDKFLEAEDKIQVAINNLELKKKKLAERTKAVDKELRDILDEYDFKNRIYGRMRGVKKDPLTGVSYYENQTPGFRGKNPTTGKPQDWNAEEYERLDEYLKSRGFGEDEMMMDDEGGVTIGGAKRRRRRAPRKAPRKSPKRKRSPAQIRATKALVKMNKERAKLRRL